MKFSYLMSIAFCLCVNFSLFCMEAPPSSTPLFEIIGNNENASSLFDEWINNAQYQISKQKPINNLDSKDNPDSNKNKNIFQDIKNNLENINNIKNKKDIVECMLIYNMILQTKPIPDSETKCYYPYSFHKKLAPVFIEKLNQEKNNPAYPYIIDQQKSNDKELVIINKNVTEKDRMELVFIFQDESRKQDELEEDLTKTPFEFKEKYVKNIDLPDKVSIDKQALENFISESLLNPELSLDPLFVLAINFAKAPESRTFLNMERYKEKTYFPLSSDHSKQQVENQKKEPKAIFINRVLNAQELKNEFALLPNKQAGKNQWDSNISFSSDNKVRVIASLVNSIEALQQKLPLTTISLKQNESSATIEIVHNILPIFSNLNRGITPTRITINFDNTLKKDTVSRKWTEKELADHSLNPEKYTNKIDIINMQESAYDNLIKAIIPNNTFQYVDNVFKNDERLQAALKTFSFNHQATIAIFKTQRSLLSFIDNSFGQITQALAVNLVKSHEEKLNKFCISFGLLAQITAAQKKLYQTKKELKFDEKKLTNYMNSIKQLQNTNLKKLSPEQQKKLYDDCITTLEAQLNI